MTIDLLDKEYQEDQKLFEKNRKINIGILIFIGIVLIAVPTIQSILF